jgi:hypothetical protein
MPRLRPQELRATPREAQEQDEDDDVIFVSIRDVLIGQSVIFCIFGSHFDGHRLSGVKFGFSGNPSFSL